MQTRLNSNLTPCQQNIYDMVAGRLASPTPTLTIINSEPGSGMSTLMERLTGFVGESCLNIKSRPAISGLNLLEAFYYHLGLWGEGISHRSPIPEFVRPLVEIQNFTGIFIEDIDDFALTTRMKSVAISHLSKIASAVPKASIIISQTLYRSDIDCSIHHRDIVAIQERNEYYLRSFSGLQEYLDFFEAVAALIEIQNIPKLDFRELYYATEGNLASSVQHFCHPFLAKKWS